MNRRKFSMLDFDRHPPHRDVPPPATKAPRRITRISEAKRLADELARSRNEYIVVTWHSERCYELHAEDGRGYDTRAVVYTAR